MGSIPGGLGEAVRAAPDTAVVADIRRGGTAGTSATLTRAFLGLVLLTVPLARRGEEGGCAVASLARRGEPGSSAVAPLARPGEEGGCAVAPLARRGAPGSSAVAPLARRGGRGGCAVATLVLLAALPSALLEVLGVRFRALTGPFEASEAAVAPLLGRRMGLPTALGRLID